MGLQAGVDSLDSTSWSALVYARARIGRLPASAMITRYFIVSSTAGEAGLWGPWPHRPQLRSVLSGGRLDRWSGKRDVAVYWEKAVASGDALLARALGGH